jgi:hypothetical protein
MHPSNVLLFQHDSRLVEEGKEVEEDKEEEVGGGTG